VCRTVRTNGECVVTVAHCTVTRDNRLLFKLFVLCEIFAFYHAYFQIMVFANIRMYSDFEDDNSSPHEEVPLMAND